MEASVERDALERTANRLWWALVFEGVVAILFGILAIVYPGLTLLTLLVLFGIFALVDGVAAIIAGIGNRRWWEYFIFGILGIAAGIITFAYPVRTLLVLYFIVAVWAILRGIMHLVAALKPYATHTARWLLGISGVLGVIFGILLFSYPIPGLLALAWLLGFYALIYGFTMIALGLELRGFVREMRTTAVQY